MNISCQHFSLAELDCSLYHARLSVPNNEDAWHEFASPLEMDLIHLLIEQSNPRQPGHLHCLTDSTMFSYLDAIGLGDKVPVRGIYCETRIPHHLAAQEPETCLFELLHDWIRFLDSADYLEGEQPVRAEAKIYQFHCRSLLVDARSLEWRHDPGEVSAITKRLQQESFPGVVLRSAFCDGNVVLFFREHIPYETEAQTSLQLEYNPADQKIVVSSESGESFLLTSVSPALLDPTSIPVILPTPYAESDRGR